MVKGGDEVKAERVIMDIDHNKLAPKDHIFMDFLSLYGQESILAKKNPQSSG